MEIGTGEGEEAGERRSGRGGGRREDGREGGKGRGGGAGGEARGKEREGATVARGLRHTHGEEREGGER